MKKILHGALLPLILISFVFFAGCPAAGTDSSDVKVTLSKVEQNGSAAQTTYLLTLTFSEAIPGLTADDINLSGVEGVTKGALRKADTSPVYTLPVSGFTTGGQLTVTAAKAGFEIIGSPKIVTINYSEVANDELVNSVWMGTTPQNNGKGWLTITFRSGGRAIWAFNTDNTTNEWVYTFDNNDSGTVINPAGGWTPAPNGFTVSGDTLTITNYGNHTGGPRTFKQVRQADLTVTDPVPFTIETLDDNLIDSVWGGSTPASSNTSWLTISFRAKRTAEGLYEAEMAGDNVAVLSYAHDNTTAVWEYSYTSADKTGTAFTNGRKPDGFATSWNPGAYTISEDGLTMTFTSFMGQERSFKRYR